MIWVLSLQRTHDVKIDVRLDYFLIKLNLKFHGYYIWKKDFKKNISLTKYAHLTVVFSAGSKNN